MSPASAIARLRLPSSVREVYSNTRRPASWVTVAERLAQLTSRFLTDFCLLVGDWANRAAEIVATWPDDTRQASHDPVVIAETIRRAAAGER